MNSYQFCGADKISTPALIYYKDFIEDNIHKTIAMAGGPERLWPHVKTHKMAEMVRLQMAAGINRFKCATIAEAEMAAGCGAADVLLAYPLAGPNIRRFFMLTELFSKVRFWAVGDDGSLLEELGALFYAVGRTANVLADVNPGLDRTGVALQDAAGFFMECGSIKGISMKGLHCYDGNRTEQDPAERRKQALLCEEAIKEVCEKLKDSGYSCEVLVLGGTPSLPCHADFAIPGTEIYLSPGTCLVND